jgi:uroporphyrinogen-III synthase
MSDLAGLTIVITRPAVQAEEPANLFEHHGAEVIRYPVLAITALDAATLQANLDATPIAQSDALVFVSANAVEFGAGAIRGAGGFHKRQRVYAIGLATAHALRERHVANVVTPSSGNDSEALLVLPELQNVAGQTIVIAKGLSDSGGRVALEQTLRGRGATVATFNCYTRHAAAPSADARRALTAAPRTLVFSVLSVETLDSLNENLRRDSREDAYARGMMLVPHARIAAAASAAGWRHVEIVPMALDGMLAAICALRPRVLELAAEELKKADHG